MSGCTQERATWTTMVCAAVIIGLCTLASASPSYGQGSLDLQAIIQDTQKMSRNPDDMTMVWWLTEQFWQASLAQDPSIPKAQVDQILATLKPYTMIAVVDGRIGAFGGVTYKSEAAVRSTTSIQDGGGGNYTPLGESAIGPDMKNLVQILKPVIVNMLGPLGENMHFIVFQSKTKDGRPVADPTMEGSLKVAVAQQDFQYRLPLGSSLPPRFDPKTREQFPGNYKFNPFTGAPLVTDPAK